MAEVRGHGVAMATAACLSPYRLAALERTMARKSTASSSTQAATCRRGSTRRTSGEQTAGRCRTPASVRSVCRRRYDHLLRHLFPLVVLCCVVLCCVVSVVSLYVFCFFILMQVLMFVVYFTTHLAQHPQVTAGILVLLERFQHWCLSLQTPAAPQE